MDRDKAYLGHVVEAIETIEEYTRELDKDKFANKENKMIQDATMRELEIIGEAVGRISDELKKSNPSIRWREISDMRNKLIHEYFGVDLEIVWAVVEKDLPFLKKTIRSLL